MPPGRKRSAFSLLEVLFCLALFGTLSIIGALCLLQVSRVWQRSSARDLAFRELHRAHTALRRDLVNAGRGVRQSLFSPVAAGSATVNTGDALALVLPRADRMELQLDAGGGAVLDRLVTYYLAVPANLEALTGLRHTFAADADGYEDQCAYKWLVRKETGAPAPSAADQPSEVPVNWFSSGVVEIPSVVWQEPQRRVVAMNLLSLRVRQGPPLWEITLTAVAVGDARRNLAMGAVHLSGTKYALSQQVAVVARN